MPLLCQTERNLAKNPKLAQTYTQEIEKLLQAEYVVSVSFIMARSRVAPKKQLTIPHLELSTALTGAQLAQLLKNELMIPLYMQVQSVCSQLHHRNPGPNLP